MLNFRYGIPQDSKGLEPLLERIIKEPMLYLSFMTSPNNKVLTIFKIFGWEKYFIHLFRSKSMPYPTFNFAY